MQHGLHSFLELDHEEKRDSVAYDHTEHNCQIYPLAPACLNLIQILHYIETCDRRPNRFSIHD
jgi:hypothetical protein